MVSGRTPALVGGTARRNGISLEALRITERARRRRSTSLAETKGEHATHEHRRNRLRRDLLVSMDWALVIVFYMFQPCLSVLLTVEAEQPRYESDFRGDVVMGCHFQPKLSNPRESLKVTWHWITASSSREVYRMDDSQESLDSQHPDYRGRVTFLAKELQEGWAKIQLSELRINDSGTYQCLVQTEEGADYKEIALSVTASYEAVTKHLQKAAEGDQVLLSCQSEGYPEPSVTWLDGRQQRIEPSTTVASTPEQLLKVTSQIRVRSSDINNYTCSFSNGRASATFHIPDELPIPPAKNDAVVIALCVALIMVIVIAAVLIYRRRKGSRRNFMGGDQDRSVTAADCVRANNENREDIAIYNAVKSPRETSTSPP